MNMNNYMNKTMNKHIEQAAGMLYDARPRVGLNPLTTCERASRLATAEQCGLKRLFRATAWQQ